MARRSCRPVAMNFRNRKSARAAFWCTALTGGCPAKLGDPSENAFREIVPGRTPGIQIVISSHLRPLLSSAPFPPCHVEKLTRDIAKTRDIEIGVQPNDSLITPLILPSGARRRARRSPLPGGMAAGFVP